MPTSLYDINRKHSIDHNYFKTINTQEKAYWLGFLWADGAISKTAKRCSGKNRMTITQKATSAKHLEQFAKAINTPFNTRQATGSYQGQVQISLSVNSRLFCIHLETLGFGTKSERIHVPNIPSDLIRHFIRGYFDGDGCLSIYTQTSQKTPILRQEFSLTGNETLMLKIQQILNAQTSVSRHVRLKRYKRTNKVVSLRYGKKADIITLDHYLYDNATIYLEEKRNKFIEFYSRQS